jgi:hypothetical protein
VRRSIITQNINYLTATYKMQFQAFEGAVAAGVVAGAGAEDALSVDFEDEPESETEPLVGAGDPEAEAAESDDSAFDSPPLAAGFTEAYPSLYQPPPLNEMAAAVIVRSSGPPQVGQTVRSASENF